MKQLIKHIVSMLSDDLRRAPYKGHLNPLTGHCYVASEALFHLKAKDLGYRPFFIRHENSPHWFLKDDKGNVLDITAGQFSSKVPYDKAVGKGFLTKKPSKRANQLMKLVRSSI